MRCAVLLLFVAGVLSQSQPSAWPAVYSTTVYHQHSVADVPQPITVFRWFYDALTYSPTGLVDPMTRRERIDSKNPDGDQHQRFYFFDANPDVEYDIVEMENMVSCNYGSPRDHGVPIPPMTPAWTYLGTTLISGVKTYHWRREDQQHHTREEYWDTTDSERLPIRYLREDQTSPTSFVLDVYEYAEFGPCAALDTEIFTIPPSLMVDGICEVRAPPVTVTNPKWPLIFSATVYHKHIQQGMAMITQYRWFYDEVAKLDRYDSTIIIDGQEAYQNLYEDYSLATPMSTQVIRRVGGEIECWTFQPPGRTLPVPDFSKFQHHQNTTILYVPVYEWDYPSTPPDHPWSEWYYDRRDDGPKRHPVRWDRFDQMTFDEDIFEYSEFDECAAEDPDLFKVPVTIQPYCNPRP